MSTYQQQKQHVLQLFQATISFARTREHQEIAQRLDKAAKRLAGEFKQGKSSLLNAIINEPSLFPVDVDITTNLVSTIAYGQQEKITVVLGKPGKEKNQQIRRDEIPDYVTEQWNRGNTRQAQVMVIESPNQKLKEGLVLVDTPGVGGLNVQHTKFTYAFVPNADAILFVSDSIAPLSTKELDFVKMIVRHCQNIIFVVAKIDAVANYQEIVESNREKLTQVLERPGDRIPLIPVSSLAKLAYLQSQEAEDLEDSNFATLERELWQLLNQQRGYILLLRVLSELGQSLAEMKMPIQAEWEASQQRNQQELDDMERQLEEAQAHLQSLQNNSAKWRTQLSDGLIDVRSEMQESFQEGFSQIRYRADEYLDDVRLIESPEQIASLLEVDIDALVSALGEQLSQLTANLHAQVEASTGLGINPFEIGPLVWEKVKFSTEGARLQKSELWEKALNATRNGMFNSSTGSTIGSLIGGAIGAGIGLLFGGVGSSAGAAIGAGIGASLAGIAGLSTGVKQGLQQVQEKDRALAKRESSRIIKPLIDKSQRLCNGTLNDTVKQLERFMRDELSSQINRKKETFERSLQAIRRTRKLSQEQVARKVTELKTPLQKLNQFQKSVEELTRVTVEQNIAVSPSSYPTTDLGQAKASPAPETSKQTATANADCRDWADE